MTDSLDIKRVTVDPLKAVEVPGPGRYFAILSASDDLRVKFVFDDSVIENDIPVGLGVSFQRSFQRLFITATGEAEQVRILISDQPVVDNRLNGTMDLNGALSVLETAAQSHVTHPLQVVDGSGVPVGENLSGGNLVQSQYATDLGGGAYMREGVGYVLAAKLNMSDLVVGGEYAVSAKFYSDGVGLTYVRSVVNGTASEVVASQDRGVDDVIEFTVVGSEDDIVLEFKGNDAGAGSNRYFLSDIDARYLDKSKAVLPVNTKRRKAAVQIDGPCFIDREDGVRVSGAFEWEEQSALKLISESGDPVNVRILESLNV